MSKVDPPMWPEAVLFDLDGTLIDSAPDIAAATNELLGMTGLGPLAVEAVRRMIGNGVEKMVERAFLAVGWQLSAEALSNAVVDMMVIYARHLTGLTMLMPGALEVVARLGRAGKKVAVISNKPNSFTSEILDYYGFSPHLAAMQGAEPGLAKKPAPDMLLNVLCKLSVLPENALFVGDSVTDVGAARAAGIRVVLVRGGYSDMGLEHLGADGIVDNFEEMLPFAS